MPDCDLNEWMVLAKARGMTWVEGLVVTIHNPDRL